MTLFRALFCVLTVTLGAASALAVPQEGAYKVVGGGLLSSTCASMDNTSLDQLPWWTIRVVGLDAVNLRQSVNPYAQHRPASPFGFFSMLSTGFDSYEGTGWVVEQDYGPYGLCSVKREIAARLDVFSAGGPLLRATVRETYLNPSYEAQNCIRNGRIECGYTFEYDLEYADEFNP